jgi:hypothetical protein
VSKSILETVRYLVGIVQEGGRGVVELNEGAEGRVEFGLRGRK